MTRDRWVDVSRVVDAALEIPSDQRAAFVTQACADDSELRRAVERLLSACEHAEQGDGFLAATASAYVEPVLGDLAAWNASAATVVCSLIAAGLSGRYTIEREIGHGGMAFVYLARDDRLHRKVAIKVLAPDVGRDLGSTRFLREIEIAARLEHPHIVPVHDAGTAAGLLYYVMRFVDGESLNDRLARERQLPLQTAVAIAGDVAEALDYAHAHGVVHRDIKPGNILLDTERAVVTDFGVARAIEVASSQQITQTGVVLGTPPYMSPEQAAGDAAIDGRSDVYSLACVVFEMFAGEPPFTGPSPQAVLAKHMQAPIPDLRVVRPTVGMRTQEVVSTALAKVPADRFATASEFVRALQDSLIAAHNTRKHRRLAGAAAAIALPAAIMLFHNGTPPSVPAGRFIDGVPTEVPRIAVLYFEDLSPDSSLRHIADGLTEELIYELSGVNAFRVISRGGVKPYRGRQVPVDSIVSSLGVTTIVEGSIQRDRNRLRVVVQLIDAKSNTYADRTAVEQPLADVIALERQVAQQVAVALRRRMGREVRLRGAGLGTTSPPARELVLRAQRARDDAETLAEHPHPMDLRTAFESLVRAESLLVLAQRADPRWIRPILDRGWIARERARLVHGVARTKAGEQGLVHAEDVLRRSPLNAEALELRGTLRWILARARGTDSTEQARLNLAEADLRTAVGQDSSRANAWATLSSVLIVKGRFAEAAIAAERALREDAYFTGARDILEQLFYTAVWRGDKSSAADWCHRGRVSFPGYWRFIECELTLLREDLDAKPDARRAWALVEELERVYSSEQARAAGNLYTPVYWRVVAAAISARAGRRDVARAELARAIRATESDSTLRLDLLYDEAYLRFVLGERQQAQELLLHLVKARPRLRSALLRDPLFRDLNVAQLFQGATR
jgi:serine/threonine-protein kinase